MAHNHDHSHGHNHNPVLTSINKAFVIGIVLNSAYVLFEAGAGFYTGSLALLTDAGHNLSDVAGLLLSLMAFRLAKVGSSTTYTYGYNKSTVLISLLNALILLVAVGVIGYEAINRFFHPQPIQGGIMAIIAGIGIVINGFSAWLFWKGKEKDLNVKGAYLHMAADAAVSLGVVIGGIILQFTGIEWIDPLISIVIAVVIVWSTLGLLKSSLKLSLDGVPDDVSISVIKKAALKIEGVKDLHHIHIWAISTSKNAITAHAVIHKSSTWEDAEKIKSRLKHEFEHLNIIHATIETELENTGCDSVKC